MKHDRKGLLSIANSGPGSQTQCMLCQQGGLQQRDCSCVPKCSIVHADTNTAHFSIMMGPDPHNDGHYTVFGAVVVLLVLPICVSLLQ